MAPGKSRAIRCGLWRTGAHDPDGAAEAAFTRAARAEQLLNHARDVVGTGQPLMYRNAHHHLAAVVNAEIPPGQESVTILDAGCGDGLLITLLHDQLQRLRPGLRVSIYGFDVSDSGVQEVGYFEGTLRHLARRVPDVDWSKRIRLIRSADAWPYADETFDLVISNHVMEHVEDPAHFLAQIHRVLRPGGRSVNLFPLRHYLFEGHLNLPFAHWIRDHDALREYIRLLSYLGLGNLRRHRRERPNLTREEYAERQADYLIHFTHYLSRRELLDFTQATHLRCSFRYTENFYTNRLRMLFRLPPCEQIRPLQSGMLSSVLTFLLMWVSSVTVFLEKKQTFRDLTPPSR